MPDAVAIPTTAKPRRLLLIAGVIVIALIILAPVGYLLAYSGRILPGVEVAGIHIGGLSKEEALSKINATFTIYGKSAGSFSYKEQSVRTTLTPDILQLFPEQAVATAYGVGREASLIDRPFAAFEALLGQKKFSAPYAFDSAKLKSALRKDWQKYEKSVNDAKLSISVLPNYTNVKFTPDTSGFEFDYSRAVSAFGDQIALLNKDAIELQPSKTEPAIKTADVQKASELVPTALALAPIKLSADDKHWTMASADLAPMLEVYITDNQTPSLRLNLKAATAYFSKLAGEYDITPEATRFEIDPTTKKMTAFTAGQDGRKINVGRSIDILNQTLADQLAGKTSATPYNLVSEVAKSPVITATAADLGIQEAIGIGRSDFSGSSSNRIKNIKNGISKINGALVAPDQEFSVDALLEPVTLENGYFMEQIIKNNLIQTDVGGGLCQVGTTMFRAAMNAGLPITERQNHALVVHYYNDATNGNPGTDATIYGPHPDLRFRNNTGHWLLITTSINVKRNALAFTIWGTPDGRQGSYTPPKVIRWIEPPTEPVKTESTDIEVGKEKCQSPFRGADTTFAYTIKNADGTVTTRDFFSHYKALPKICLVGVAKPVTADPSQPITTNTPTPAEPLNNINANANTNSPAANLPPEATAGN
jgi:vancomycin resistance protein YoaR